MKNKTIIANYHCYKKFILMNNIKMQNLYINHVKKYNQSGLVQYNT